MKKYKLLKDTPTIKAGTVFEEVVGDFDGLKALTRITPVGAKTSPQFTIKDIDNFDEWFEEISEYKRRRAKIGDLYHFINDCGDINYGCDHNNPWDNHRYNTDNYGLTKEELEAKREYYIARQVLLDDAEGGKFIPGKENWSSVYDDTDHLWRIQYYYLYHQGGICFRDKKSIEKSLETHKEQWEIVRKYEIGEKIND